MLYRNEGGGRFKDMTNSWNATNVAGKALGMAFADFDGTGRQMAA